MVPSSRRGGARAVEGDDFGNLVAWWDAGRRPAVVTGSHLDSVLDGGAHDGPLGVVAAPAAVDLMRSRGVVRRRGLIGVSVFVEEEGRASGSPASARGWRPARSRGRPPAGLRTATAAGSGDVGRRAARRRCWSGGRHRFVEPCHVEQGRDLVDRGAAIGVASEIRLHGRYRRLQPGEANHAGHHADGGPVRTRCSPTR